MRATFSPERKNDIVDASATVKDGYVPLVLAAKNRLTECENLKSKKALDNAAENMLGVLGDLEKSTKCAVFMSLTTFFTLILQKANAA